MSTPWGKYTPSASIFAQIAAIRAKHLPLLGHPALATLPKRPIVPFDPPSDPERLMADTFPGWVPEDDTATRLSRLEAKLDELLALERSRQLREDYERLTAEWRARGGR